MKKLRFANSHRLMLALMWLLAAGIASSVAKADEPRVCLNENGSFEVGPNPGGFTVYSAGQAFIPNWKVTSASIDHIGTYFSCSDGNNCIDMDGTPGYGVIETTAQTNPGQTYSLTFDLSGNHQGPPAVKRIVVEAAGQSASFQDTPGQWTAHSLSFTATSATTTIRFSSGDTTGDYFGALLDNVCVPGGRPGPAEAVLSFYYRSGGNWLPAGPEGVPYGAPFLVEAAFDRAPDEAPVIDLDWPGMTAPLSLALEPVAGSDVVFRSYWLVMSEAGRVTAYARP